MPEQSELPIDRPAPPSRTRGSESRPAAPPSRTDTHTDTRTEMPTIPQSLKELVMNVASAKNEIAGDGRKGQEVLEQAGRLQARKRMTEEREVWDKKFDIKRLAKRIWHDGIHQRALYAREKATAQQMMAEGRLQSDIPYQFQREVRAAAQQQIEQNHANERGVKKLGTKAKDFLKQATLAQRELHRREVATMRNLRLGLQYQGVDLNTIIDANQRREAQAAINFVNANRDLFKNYRNVLTGDFQATEALAQRLGADMGNDALRGAIGEKKAGQQVEITGELRQFFNDDVIMPLLREGLQNGRIREETLLDVRTRVQDVFMTKRFAEWRNGLSEDARKQFDVSLSYGTDVIPMVERLLPQLQGVKDQLLAGENLKTYVNEIVLKANLGTLKAGADTSIGETILEKWTSRQLTNKRVQELYNNVAAGREPKPLHPNAYNSALEPSAARANALNELFKLGGGHVSAGLLAGAGIYTGQRFAGMGARMVLPILGGSAVAGAIRMWQERTRYTREVEQHRRETAEGAKFPSDAKRRQEMEGFNLPMLNFQEAINPLAQGRQRIEAGNASVDDLARMLGALADRQARISLMNTRGVDLYRTDANTPYDVQKTKLELENARAMRTLRNYFANGQHAAELQTLSQRFGNVAVDPNNIVSSFTTNIFELRRNNIVRGTGLDTNIASAFGGSVDQAASIDSREHAMVVARRWAMARQGGMTFGMAVIGSLGGQEVVGLFERMGHAAGLWGPPRQTALEHMLHIGSEPKTQNFPGTEVLQTGKPHMSEYLFKVDGAKLDVKMPSGLIPKDAHVIQDGHHFLLVSGKGHHIKELIGMHVDKSGQPVLDQVKGGINLHDLHIKASTEPGKPMHEPVTGQHGLWHQYTKETPEEWYANNTNTPDLNELKFHTIKMGGSVSLVPENMQTSFEHGLVPEHYYVPGDVEQKGNMWYAFNVGGDNRLLTVQAPSHQGILTLNPNDHDPYHTYMTGTGKRIQAGVLARMILNEQTVKGLHNGDIATELNGHENVFNLGGPNGEAGIISQGTMHDGTFQSFASIHGTGHLPESLTTPGQPTYHIEITQTMHEIAGGRVEKPTDPFPLPFGPWPRRPLEAGEETTEEPQAPPVDKDRDTLGPYGSEFARAFTPEQTDFYKERRSERLRNDPNAKLRFEEEVPDYFQRQNPEYLEELEEYLAQEGMSEPMHEDVEAIVAIPVYTLGEGQAVKDALENYFIQIDKTRNKNAIDPNKFELVLFLNYPADIREQLAETIGGSIYDGAEERVRNGTPEKYDTEEVIRQFQEAHPELKIRIMKKEFPTKPQWGDIIKPLYDAALLRSLRRNNPNNIDPVIITNDIDVVNMSPIYISTILEEVHKNDALVEANPDLTRVDAFVGNIDMPNHGYENYPGFLVAQRLFQFLDAQQRYNPDGAPITQGRSSIIRASSYAAIGGVNAQTDAGADTELGRMIQWSRGNTKTIRYINRAWLESDPRRELSAWRQGMPLGYAWDSWGDYAMYGPGWKERFNDPPEDPSKLDKDFLEREIYFEMERWGLTSSSPELRHALAFIGFGSEDYHIGQRTLLHPRQGEITVDTIIIDNLDQVASNLRRYIDERRWERTERRIQRELGNTQEDQGQDETDTSAPNSRETLERIAREQGRAWQESHPLATDEDQQIAALRSAQQFLNRPLDNEERDIVINNPNWGEELAWRMAQRGVRSETSSPEASSVPGTPPVETKTTESDATTNGSPVTESNSPPPPRSVLSRIADRIRNRTRSSTSASEESVTLNALETPPAVDGTETTELGSPESPSSAETRRQLRDQARTARATVGVNAAEQIRRSGQALQSRFSTLDEAGRLSEAQLLKGQQPLTDAERERVIRNDDDSWVADIMLNGIRGDLAGEMLPTASDELPTEPVPVVSNEDGALAQGSEGSSQPRQRPFTEEDEMELNRRTQEITDRVIAQIDAGTPPMPMKERVRLASELVRGRILTPLEREALDDIYWPATILQMQLAEMRLANAEAALSSTNPRTALPAEQTPEATNLQEPLSAAVEQLINPDDLLGQVNRGLETVGNANGREQTFTMLPDVLASYLQNSEGLFPGSKVSGLNMYFSGNTLHIRGRVDRRVGPMTIPVQLDDVACIVNEQGELQLVGDPQFHYERSLPERMRQIANNKVNEAFSDIDVRLRELLSRQTPGWEVSGFSVVENNVGPQIGIQFRNTQLEPVTAPLPVTESATQPARHRFRN